LVTELKDLAFKKFTAVVINLGKAISKTENEEGARYLYGLFLEQRTDSNMLQVAKIIPGSPGSGSTR
jgi:hypothetical protein